MDGIQSKKLNSLYNAELNGMSIFYELLKSRSLHLNQITYSFTAEFSYVSMILTQIIIRFYYNIISGKIKSLFKFI